VSTVPRRSGTAATRRPGFTGRVAPVAVLIALMWLSELFDLLTPVNLDLYGIRPRDPGHLVGVALSPFLHLGFGHLMANTVSLAVLGVLLALTTRRLWLVTVGVTLLGGAGVWLFGGANTVHIGASGVVYGYAAFLAGYGFVTRHLGQAAIAVLVIVLYGSLLWGVLPTQVGVSWQAHLFGALAGLLLAVWAGRRDRVVRPRR
jgi:membrane associated rhomboid family serine protease